MIPSNSKSPKSLLGLALLAVFGLVGLCHSALALSEADREEVFTSCEEKLRSSWARLTYTKNASVAVQFRLLPDGGYAAPVVFGSSGDKGLDNCAINAIDGAVPFQKFNDRAFDVIAHFDTAGKGDVSVSPVGGSRGRSVAERKIAVHKKYHENAIKIMVDRITKAEKVLGKDNFKLFESVRFLANEYKEAGDFAKAEETYQRALALAKKAKPEESKEEAAVLLGMGELYLARGDRAKADASFQKIVDMKMPPTKETALALENQAKLLYKDGKQKEADEIYKRIRTLNIK